MAWQPTTRLHVSGYRFLLRRLECALLRRSLYAVNEPIRARPASLALGCLLAAIIAAACAVLTLLRPQPALGDASAPHPPRGRSPAEQMLQPRVMSSWPPLVWPDWVRGRGSRAATAPVLTAAVSTKKQIVAPVSATPFATRSAGGGIVVDRSRGLLVAVGGASVLTAATTSITPLPTTGSHPPGG